MKNLRYSCFVVIAYLPGDEALYSFWLIIQKHSLLLVCSKVQCCLHFDSIFDREKKPAHHQYILWCKNYLILSCHRTCTKYMYIFCSITVINSVEVDSEYRWFVTWNPFETTFTTFNGGHCREVWLVSWKAWYQRLGHVWRNSIALGIFHFILMSVSDLSSARYKIT